MQQPLPSLLDYFENEYALFRTLAEGSAANLKRTILQFAAWRGSMPSLDELDDQLASRWVQHLQSRYRPKTAFNKRAEILCVWLDAFHCDKTGRVKQPLRVRPVKVPDPEPDSWDKQQMVAMISVARGIGGYFRFGPARALYLEAILRATWETGLRRGDVLRLKMSQIGCDGTIQIAQNKTGVVHCGKIEPETMTLLRKIGRDPPLSFSMHISGLEYWMTKIRSEAGVGDRGQFQRIRGSAATDIAIHQPGKQTRFLGHTSPKADKWYIDRKRLPTEAITPQRLELG